MEEFSNANTSAPMLISFDPDEVRRQARASTQRFSEGILVYMHMRTSEFYLLCQLFSTLISSL